VIRITYKAVEFEFLYQGDRGLEMLVPQDIWERIVESANKALEVDHAESCFQNFRMISVAIECLAKF
jgi:hypothetical protein